MVEQQLLVEMEVLMGQVEPVVLEQHLVLTELLQQELVVEEVVLKLDLVVQRALVVVELVIVEEELLIQVVVLEVRQHLVHMPEVAES